MWNLLFNSIYFKFIFRILSKWHLILVGGSLIVTYWVFMGLQQIGLIDRATTILKYSIKDSAILARNCTPQLLIFSDFLKCIKNPSRYGSTDFETRDYEKYFDGSWVDSQDLPIPNPYDSE